MAPPCFRLCCSIPETLHGRALIQVSAVDFGFTAEEIAELSSTTIISAGKEPKRIRGER